MDQGQSEPSKHLLDEFETKLIRVKAARLARRGLILRSDVEDVRQELALAVLVAHGKVDLDPKTRRGLASRVVDHAASNLVRNRRCPKRDPGRLESLDALVASAREPNVIYEVSIPSPEPSVQLQLDVAELLETLPEDLRAVAELLKSRNVTDVAEALGVARTTLYGSVQALRRRFIRAGLAEYLPKSVVTSHANGVVPR